jgi:hypothetical protein
MSNDELIEEDKRAIKQRPTTLKYQCYLNENKDGMRYISLGLGRSGLERQGWVIGVTPLKSVVGRQHPIFKADPLESVVGRQHPIFKADPL